MKARNMSTVQEFGVTLEFGERRIFEHFLEEQQITCTVLSGTLNFAFWLN